MTKSCKVLYVLITVAILSEKSLSAVYFTSRKFECGQYGFACESNRKLRLCDDDKLYGPSFLCPSNTVCNEESPDVCESFINYVDPTIKTGVKCRRNERIADPSVPGCKGYILCVAKNKRFQSIKFKCAGQTIFNGFSRTCSSPDKYKCPLTNTTKNGSTPELYSASVENDSTEFTDRFINKATPIPKGSLNCKHYKFTVTESQNRNRAEYFCPIRPVNGESVTRCTVFSNEFCITLERDDEDQFVQNSGAAKRKPRIETTAMIV